jgi:hypothetical protein
VLGEHPLEAEGDLRHPRAQGGRERLALGVAGQHRVGRVLAARQAHRLHQEATAHALLESGQHRPLAGLVGVERQQHPLRVEPRERLRLLGGQVGAEGRHRVPEPRLVERQHVHVPLDDDDLAGLADGRPRLVEAVQQLALLEQRRLGRVEVLRQRVAEHPTGEADEPPERVAHREHEALTEAVVAPTALVLGDQAELEQVVVAHPLGEQVLEQAVPAIGREAQPPGRRGGVLDAAVAQVGLGRATGQAGAEVGQGGLVHLQQVAPAPLPRRAAAHLDAHPLAEEAQRVAELHALGPHHELEGVALGAAAEAVEEAAVDVDVERRGALGMEGAQALQLAATGGLERHRLPHQLRQVDPRPDLLLGVVELAHGPPARLTCRRPPGRAAGGRGRPRRRARRPR